jgi:hypothetical protein
VKILAQTRLSLFNANVATLTDKAFASNSQNQKVYSRNADILSEFKTNYRNSNKVSTFLLYLSAIQETTASSDKTTYLLTILWSQFD